VVSQNRTFVGYVKVKVDKYATFPTAFAASCGGAGGKSIRSYEMAKLTTAFTVLFFSIGVASADEFAANIKKVDGNKITVNKSTVDQKVEDMTLTATDKIKVIAKKPAIVDDGNGGFTIEFADVELSDGLKNKAFSKTVRARIKTDAKNNVIEVRIHLGLRSLFDNDDDNLNLLIPDLFIPPVAVIRSR